MALLNVRNAAKAFGGVRAVDGCTFAVEAGTITGLIGPNGAGKTTMFNMINGLHRPDSGEIIFEGKNIEHLEPHKITRAGISRTFQISRQLSSLTVLENVVVQAPARGIASLFKNAVLGAERDRAMALLDFVGLAQFADKTAAHLSYGQKKLMDIAAGMMAGPRLLLLDEPAGGINPALLDTIIDRIQKLQAQGVTVLVVEHNMEMVMNVCNPVVVMAYGTVLAEGPPSAIQKNDAVLEAYLGVS